ncbi:MAG: DUF2283 domain-containing protein [Candidatus Thorarchaeota archaeon]|nr:DUF2283 domain-containing protein [Candidatus Thorarchaeota archaeon]
MRIDYDPVADAVYFHFRSAEVVESLELRDGVIVDYAADGSVCGIEILSYSKRKIDLNRLITLREEEIVAEVAAI